MPNAVKIIGSPTALNLASVKLGRYEKFMRRNRRHEILIRQNIKRGKMNGITHVPDRAGFVC